MKVKLSCFYGAETPGTVIKVDDKEGRRLIDQKAATETDEPTAKERAEAAEKAEGVAAKEATKTASAKAKAEGVAAKEATKPTGDPA